MTNALVIITGASSGLGEAMARVFAEAGYALALFARNKSVLEKLNLPNSICEAVDVTNFHALKTAIEMAEEKFGAVDCLINNAGVAKRGDFIEVDHDVHGNIIDTNIKGVINGIEIVLPGMRARKHGSIFNISSLSDRTIRPEHSVYAASKAAIKSLTESLRVANAKYGIRFSNFVPAKIHTPMWKNQDFDEDFFISSKEFAEMVLWVYERRQNVCIRDIVIAPTNYEP